MTHRPSITRPLTVLTLIPATLLALLPLACGPATGGGEDAGGQSPAAEATGAQAADGGGEPTELELPKKFLELIRAEMKEIETAMQEELGHLARAEAAEGARVARSIHESFVMEQQMTDEERQELRSLLPATFLAFDKDFHARAERMAGAFERGDFTTAAALYSEMTQACVRCHSRFATERFRGFVGGEPAGDDGPESSAEGP